MSVRERYDALKVKRQPFLDRARDCASLTIPSLQPPSGHNGTQRLPEPYQGFGARAVVSLASRLGVALMPTGTPFFSLEVPQEMLMEAGEMDVPKDLERGLIQAETVIMSEMERRSWRKPTSTVLELLVTAGNALERVMPDNTLRVYRLDQYVVVRDLSGSVIELILEEMVAPETLPPEVQQMAGQVGTAGQGVAIYTQALRTREGWRMRQEINGQLVPGMGGMFDTLPFNVLRWSAVPGEDYGRGKVEEHIADLRYLDKLSKSMIDGAALATRNVTMVRPNATGGNLARKWAKAENGDVIVGNPEDVDLKQYANSAGLQVAQIEIARIMQELSAAFLLSSSLMRNAERVTATEVRMVAEELESVLGGVYSHLAEDMQKGRLVVLMMSMQQQGKLPPVMEMVEPVLTVGLAALEREKDVMRVQTVLNALQAFPPEVMDYVDIPVLLKTFFLGLGLPESIRTEEEAAQIRQSRMAAEEGQAPMQQPLAG